MIAVDEALRLALDGLAPLPAETLALDAALGRVLAAEVHAALDLPRFAQSAVDGYALRHADIAAAPCLLPVADTVAAAAREAAPQLAPGSASRIFTGGWLPEGADTVVRQELTGREGARVRILRAVEPGTDIRRQGEELRQGEVVAAAGARITPGLLGAIAMAGLDRVTVRRRPRIAVLVTGDEVAPPGTALAPGQIADANGPLLRAYLRSWGYAEVSLRYLRDDYASVCRELDAALSTAEVVLSSGGVSVGDHDHIPAAACQCGAQTLFWKVAQKPGMPLFAARRGGALLFGLPGNPASVLVNLLVYVRAALQRLEAAPPGDWPPGRLTQPVRAESAKTLWLRMRRRIDEDGAVRLEPLDRQASHMLSNLAQAQVLVRVPPAAAVWPAGTLLRWQALDA